MRQIADVDGIEQPDGSFLQRRTHTPDPKRPFDSMRALWQLPKWNCQGVLTQAMIFCSPAACSRTRRASSRRNCW
jgi:hypothetical protein